MCASYSSTCKSTAYTDQTIILKNKVITCKILSSYLTRALPLQTFCRCKYICHYYGREYHSIGLQYRVNINFFYVIETLKIIILDYAIAHKYRNRFF